jgi:uncharacterized OB-fold protein
LEVTAKGPQKKQFPIQEGLFTWPSDHPQLIGSKCKRCGEVAFPAQKGCPACTGAEVENILLSTRGTLWTWTIQAFRPPSPPYAGPDTPDNFVPYGVGYVELPEGVRVESRLTENNPAKLKFGMEMELVIEKFKEDKDMNDLMTFAFKPVGK